MCNYEELKQNAALDVSMGPFANRAEPELNLEQE